MIETNGFVLEKNPIHLNNLIVLHAFRFRECNVDLSIAGIINLDRTDDV